MVTTVPTEKAMIFMYIGTRFKTEAVSILKVDMAFSFYGNKTKNKLHGVG
jgi:hypothetical protein